MTKPLLVAYADGPDSPALTPQQVVPGADAAATKLLFGWTPRVDGWLDQIPKDGAIGVMGGYALAGAIDRGAVHYLPVRISSLPQLLRGRLRPNVLVVRGYPSTRGLCFYGSLAWAYGAAGLADEVVVEVDHGGVELDSPLIPGNITATFESHSRVAVSSTREAGPAARAVADHVASLIPAGSTVQFGPGEVCEAVVNAIGEPVRIRSGVVSEAVVTLSERGLLRGPVTTTYLWGGARLREFAASGELLVRPIEETHDFATMAATENFVAVNTALQVGLDGSVNVERISGRSIGGVGGHSDFALGARLSPGGRSIVALRSTHSGHSTIVANANPVSTSRSDVDTVVTEYGVAEIGDADDRVRAARLIQVAAPEHREELERRAKDDGRYR